MRRIAVLCIFAIAIPAACFAQSNQTESITISTYYPSPYGVYNTLRLYPSDEPAPGNPAVQPGTMFFNKTDQKVYIYNSTAWKKVGSGGSNQKVDSGHHITPMNCSGVTNTQSAANKGMLCSVAWHANITFNQTFTRAPHVIVSSEYVSGSSDTDDCAEHGTFSSRAYPTDITPTGFKLWSGGSTLGCGSSYGQYKDYFTHSEAGWLAVGE